jgi:ADP-heptose:LPS heptosyltransferase
MTQQADIHSRELVSEFLNAFQASGVYLRDPIDRLVDLASSQNPKTAKAATDALFASLVERLADSFEPPAVLLYNRLFAQIIQRVRQTPQGQPLDAALASFALHTEGDLITRAEQLRYVRKYPDTEVAKRRVQLIAVLSRVTLGADVAITSIILERLKREFPNARLVLIGNAKAAELFGGDARLTFGEISYKRAGTLTARLLAWLDVLGSVQGLFEGLEADEYLIVDPDSRLTQLGLLPLSRQPRFCTDQATKAEIRHEYLFFPSREFGHPASHSLGQLTAIWLKAVFGGDDAGYSELHLKRADLERGTALVKQFRGQSRRPVIAINYGVGENRAKRISDEFERGLVAGLLQNGAKLIFDQGAGVDELRRNDQVVAEARRLSRDGQAVRVTEFDEMTLDTLADVSPGDADILVWRGRIGLFAALIAASDLYIGYDSAGQHLAAALSVPCVNVFAGFTSPRMAERWRPTGRAETRIIVVDTLNRPADSKEVLSAALESAERLLNNKIAI